MELAEVTNIIDVVKLAFMQFTDEAIIISASLLIFIFCILLIYWFYNRHKFKNLNHQIPATVVKNYLDSVIENSNSLKSSLLRNNGKGADNIPSVVSLDNLGTDSNSELEFLKVENEKLKESLDQSGNVDELKNKIISLEEELNSKGNDSGLSDKIKKITRERDELKDILKEYSVIEDDISNLKHLKQENKQLKEQLAALKGGDSSSSITTEPNPPSEEATSEVPINQEMPDGEVKNQEKTNLSDKKPDDRGTHNDEVKKEKSPEELLSEFENMLG